MFLPGMPPGGASAYSEILYSDKYVIWNWFGGVFHGKTELLLPKLRRLQQFSRDDSMKQGFIVLKAFKKRGDESREKICEAFLYGR
jgi:hypothetical protein